MKNFRFIHFLERIEYRVEYGSIYKNKHFLNIFFRNKDTKNLFNNDLFIMRKKIVLFLLTYREFYHFISLCLLFLIVII